MRTFDSMEWDVNTVDLNGKVAFKNKDTGEIVLAERFEHGEIRGIYFSAYKGDTNKYRQYFDREGEYLHV